MVASFSPVAQATPAISSNTSVLTIDLSGTWYKDITVELQKADGGKIWSRNNAHGANRTYNVLKNTYDVKLVQGPKSVTVDALDCQNDCTVAASDVVKTMSVGLDDWFLTA